MQFSNFETPIDYDKQDEIGSPEIKAPQHRQEPELIPHSPTEETTTPPPPPKPGKYQKMPPIYKPWGTTIPSNNDLPN